MPRIIFDQKIQIQFEEGGLSSDKNWFEFIWASYGESVVLQFAGRGQGPKNVSWVFRCLWSTDIIVFVWFSLNRISNLSQIRSWTMEILAVHASSFCVHANSLCMHACAKYFPNRSYCICLIVTKEDFKFEQNPFMNNGNISCER